MFPTWVLRAWAVVGRLSITGGLPGHCGGTTGGPEGPGLSIRSGKCHSPEMAYTHLPADAPSATPDSGRCLGAKRPMCPPRVWEILK